MTCLHCHAETTNGLALCQTCQYAASMCLTFLPVYYRNLSRWKPRRSSTRQVPGSRVLYLGEARDPERTGDRVSDTLAAADTMLIRWAMRTMDDRPGHLARVLERLLGCDDVPRFRLLCAFFDRHIVDVCTTSWVGEFVRSIRVHEAKLRALTEEVVPGWYAGACPMCAISTYVVPGLTWVTCAACGTSTAASAHLETVLDEARDWVAPPMRLAEAIVALVDAEQSVPRLHKRISKWGERGRIRQYRHTTRGYGWSEEEQRVMLVDEEVGRARYRLGDVLDALAADGATRLIDPARVRVG